MSTFNVTTTTTNKKTLRILHWWMREGRRLERLKMLRILRRMKADVSNDYGQRCVQGCIDAIKEASK